MKSYFYMKLSALLLIMFSNICSIYSLNLKKIDIAEKTLITSNKRNNKESKNFVISETITSLENSTNKETLNDNNIAINDNIKNLLKRNQAEFDLKSETVSENFLKSNKDNSSKENKIMKKFNYRKNTNSTTSNTTLPANSQNLTSNIIKEIKTESKIVVTNNAEKKITFDYATNNINNNNVYTIKKLILALSIYSQLFLIFSVISLLKLYEEYFKIKSIYCENKYSHFKILTPENKEALLANSQSYIFTSGKPEIKEEAHDEIFDFPKKKKFVKIERIVEIYRADEKSWKILGKKALRSNYSFSKYEEQTVKTPDMIEEMDGDEKEDNFQLDINTLEQIYTFPKIFSKMFVGKVFFLLWNLRIQTNKLNVLDYLFP